MLKNYADVEIFIAIVLNFINFAHLIQSKNKPKKTIDMKKTLLSALKHGSGILLTIFALLCSCQVWAEWWNMPSGKEIYFYHPYNASSDVDWGNSVYFRIGRDNHNLAWSMSKISGTERLYHCTTSQYDNYAAYCVSNNCGWTGAGNDIYKVDTGDSYDITKNTEYFDNYSSESKDISTACRTIIAEAKKNTSEGCDYYYKSVYDAATPKKFTVSIIQPANGTITISCSNASNISGESPNYQVLPTTILTITVSANPGYDVTSFTIEGDYHMSGANYVIDGDVELSAVICGTPTAGSVTVSGGTPPQCAGVVSLNVSPTGGVTPYTYQWFRNTTSSTSGGTAVTERTSTSSYTPEEGTYYYYCTVYSSDICPSSYKASSSVTASIEVKATPILSASETSVTNSVPVTITATEATVKDGGWEITSGAGKYEYLYKETSTSAMFKGNVRDGSAVTYTITGAASNGCSSSVNVTVSQDGNICQ